ncbi:MAG: citryl-CoA lyase [Euryarchaeota archaeon]|nr:citryl-CoA lyase [Euryarchaeota archaeon]
MADEAEKWKSSITKTAPNVIVTKGYRLDELLGNVSFAGIVYLALKGELPSKAEERMMDAILAASIDHGVNTPTALSARLVASGGVPLPSAVSAGLLAIGDAHGGAIEKCAKLLQEQVRKMRESESSVSDAAKVIVKDAKERKQRIPGYGHRVHTNDPRTVRLLALAEELGVAKEHVALAKGIQDSLGADGKPLPLNVDGAIAAIASDMGFDWKMGKGFFLIGRAAGLVAHVYEEQSRYKVMRHMAVAQCEYDGPEDRQLPEGRK